MKASVRTLSEIRATCTKAARGAGCPWGVAEEAGIAARVLEAHGLPGTQALAQLFNTSRSCACTTTSDAPACGLAQMVALSDAPPADAVTMQDVVAPLLLLAPLILEGGAWRLDWAGGAAGCGPEGAWMTGQAAEVGKVTISPVPDPVQDDRDATAPSWQGRPVQNDAWSRLEALAARTYVPESDTSRATGAGPDDSNSD